MDDRTWLALVVWDEAQGEPDAGKAAVAQVVDNRTRLGYCSDKTIKGTILAHFQFSGFYFSMEHGQYVQIEKDEAGAEQHAMVLLAEAEKTSVWADCLNIATTRPEDPELEHAVLYYNPKACKAPAWATPDKFLKTIGHHDFYRA